MSDGKICSFLSWAVSTRILRGPHGERTAKRSHREITAKTAHVVQSGRYLMKISAIRAEIKKEIQYSMDLGFLDLAHCLDLEH